MPRKRRKPVTLDETGNMDKSGRQFGGFWDTFNAQQEGYTAPFTVDPTGTTYQSDFPVQETSNPDIMKQVVPTGTTPPAYVTGIVTGFPTADYDSWYFPTQTAIASGKAQAAMDTIIATGDQIGATIQQVANVGANVAQNFVPILIGIAALFLFMKFSGSGR